MTRRAGGTAALAAWRLAARARDKAFSLAIAGAFGEYGAHSVLQPPLRLHGERHVRVGAGVFVGAGSWLQVLGDPEAPDGAPPGLVLGDGVAISGACVLSAAASIVVERDVSMARGVYVADHAHAYDDPARPVRLQGITDIAPVRIGAGAWLGQNVVVLPGTTIGRGAVVSANSVVSRDVPDHALAAGTPARVLRRFAGDGGDADAAAQPR